MQRHEKQQLKICFACKYSIKLDARRQVRRDLAHFSVWFHWFRKQEKTSWHCLECVNADALAKQLGPYSRCLAWNSAMMPVICAFYTRPWLLQRPLMCRWESNTHTYELLVTTNFSCLRSPYPTGLSVGRETLWFWRTLWVKLVWVWLLTNSLWCKLFDKWEEVIQCNDNACMSWGIAHT